MRTLAWSTDANLVGDAGGHDGSDGISTGFECAGNSVHHLEAVAGLLAIAQRFRMRTLAWSTDANLVGDAGGHDGSDGISTGFECAGNSVHRLKAVAGVLAQTRRLRMRTLALRTDTNLVGDAGGHDGSDGVSTGFVYCGNSAPPLLRPIVYNRCARLAASVAEGWSGVIDNGSILPTMNR
jgi:hypothetical protein